MTRATHNPKGRPQVKPIVGSPVEQIVEDKPEPATYLCGACSAKFTDQYAFCPYCGVPLRWE